MFCGANSQQCVESWAEATFSPSTFQAVSSVPWEAWCGMSTSADGTYFQLERVEPSPV